MRTSEKTDGRVLFVPPTRTLDKIMRRQEYPRCSLDIKIQPWPIRLLQDITRCHARDFVSRSTRCDRK